MIQVPGGDPSPALQLSSAPAPAPASYELSGTARQNAKPGTETKTESQTPTAKSEMPIIAQGIAQRTVASIMWRTFAGLGVDLDGAVMVAGCVDVTSIIVGRE
ncbi:uncharacterized protein N7511_009895 [Penicillium nucicola]|uniref:uncharacterized protein n=1 Tax=Penicillium nucicola TaxID=1850975 RepID=UPI002544EAA4|nr:uncharacterized protein N7511_009895 [Penicillium nucicola]KAJ5748199.1 hypothetical protein N7511_009895 [Penicillium nucicola]